jgi:hypothetical protein
MRKWLAGVDALRRRRERCEIVAVSGVCLFVCSALLGQYGVTMTFYLYVGALLTLVGVGMSVWLSKRIRDAGLIPNFFISADAIEEIRKRKSLPEDVPNRGHGVPNEVIERLERLKGMTFGLPEQLTNALHLDPGAAWWNGVPQSEVEQLLVDRSRVYVWTDDSPLYHLAKCPDAPAAQVKGLSAGTAPRSRIRHECPVAPSPASGIPSGLSPAGGSGDTGTLG